MPRRQSASRVRRTSGTPQRVPEHAGTHHRWVPAGWAFLGAPRDADADACAPVLPRTWPGGPTITASPSARPSRISSPLPIAQPDLDLPFDRFSVGQDVDSLARAFALPRRAVAPAGSGTHARTPGTRRAAGRTRPRLARHWSALPSHSMIRPSADRKRCCSSHAEAEAALGTRSAFSAAPRAAFRVGRHPGLEA